MAGLRSVRSLLSSLRSHHRTQSRQHARSLLRFRFEGRNFGQSSANACQKIVASSSISQIPILIGAMASVLVAWFHGSAHRGNKDFSKSSRSWPRVYLLWKPRLRFGLAYPLSCSTTDQTQMVTSIESQNFVVFRRTWGQEKPFATLANLTDLFDSLSQKNSPGINVVLLGEVHDDQVAHHLQLKILKACAEICQKQGRRLVLSLEMFESDVQRVLDEYVLQRTIREADFLQDARPWANYRRDYRPLVEFCREHGFRVVAANAPRRYVSLVSRGGDAALERSLAVDEALVKSPLAAPPLGIPPLPLPSPSAAFRLKFQETIASQMQPSPSQASSGSGDTSCPYIGFRGEDVAQVKHEMVQAQQLWDHSMAFAISQALQCMKGEAQVPLVVHVCGAFHCAHGLGIPEALPLYFPDCKQAVKAKESASICSNNAWLPIDEIFEPDKVLASNVEMNADSDEIAPKVCPPGVISVVCWPASVAATRQMAQTGRVPESLSYLGDWAIITDELFNPSPPATPVHKPANKM